MVLCLEFFRQGLNGAVQEVCALIAHKNYWASKSSDDVFKMNCAAVTASQFLTALVSTHLVRYSVPVMIYLAPVSWWVDRNHEVYIPLVKCMQRNLWSQWHFISSRGFSYPLEDIAASAKVLSVFV